MKPIVDFFHHSFFKQILVDTLPFCLIVINDKGHVQTANRLVGPAFGVSKKAIIGKPIGEALGCIYAVKNAGKCGFTRFCHGCDIRNMCLAATKKNQTQKTRTHFQIKNNSRRSNFDFVINAVPFAFNNQRLIYLVIEDIPEPQPASLPARRKNDCNIVGEHPKMMKLFQSIRQVARAPVTLLIQGETGTGKELVALAIHKQSHRASNYFVPINCGALPEGLLETELFGHVKGAFTGAIRDKKGRFELADRGTLFLDEVGDLSPSMQVLLLRVLEDGIFQPVGSEKVYQADVRIICATNRDLEKDVASGLFRKDLYYRLSVIPITLPPLRERRSDIPLLAAHFLAHYGKEFFGKKAKLSSETVTMLMAYDWPGNVRELQNAIQYSLAKCPGNVIEPSHLLQVIRFAVNKSSTVRHRQPMLRTDDVINALKKTDNNKTKAAEVLGTSRSTLYRFLKNCKRSLSQSI
jgi:transcriptional regulator with PAS, ATPase and Fis domain